MLNDLENVIKNFFTQYGINVKSSNSQLHDADQVARLLADQVFLHIINQDIAPKAVKIPRAKKTKAAAEVQPLKPKRKYQRKAKVEMEAVEGAV
ncbi:MAG: hypothetical protein ACYCX4_10925 [Bacillota bacterium]